MPCNAAGMESRSTCPPGVLQNSFQMGRCPCGACTCLKVGVLARMRHHDFFLLALPRIPLWPLRPWPCSGMAGECPLSTSVSALSSPLIHIPAWQWPLGYATPIPFKAAGAIYLGVLPGCPFRGDSPLLCWRMCLCVC